MSYNVLDVCRYVINYSNKNNYEISNLKLQKVLYFIQAYFLIEKNKLCFNEKIEAWDFGPVIPKAFYEYKQYGSGNIPTIKSYIILDKNNIWDSKKIEFDDGIITNEDKILINKVINKFKNYSATDLVSLTHKQSPWIDTYIPYQNKEITINTIKEYFNN